MPSVGAEACAAAVAGGAGRGEAVVKALRWPETAGGRTRSCSRMRQIKQMSRDMADVRKMATRARVAVMVQYDFLRLVGL